MKTAIRCLSIVVAMCACRAWADEPPAALRDPSVPPAVRERARNEPHAPHADLHAQVEAKLRRSFDAADIEHRGSITRDQARAAQLGIVADNFEAIDSAHTGRVTFEDYKRFLRARGARTF
jgi:hypothetical protein